MIFHSRASLFAKAGYHVAVRKFLIAPLALALGLLGNAQAVTIDHMSVLTFKGKMQVEVLASSEQSMKDIAAFDATGKLQFRRDCPKANVCRALFVLDAAGTPQKTLTVLASDSDGKSASEVFTAQLEDKVARVYVLDKIQDDAKLLPLGSFDFLNQDLLAGTLPKEVTGDVSGSVAVDADASKSTPKLKLGHYLDGDKLVITAKATSKAGMDSIAILENGSFLDVELCSGQKQCTFTKIMARESGRRTFTVKARTITGGQQNEDLLVELP